MNVCTGTSRFQNYLTRKTPETWINPWGYILRIPKLSKLTSVLILAATLVLPIVVVADQDRWYSADQVGVGKDLYAANCAACHGKNAEATPNWRQTDDQGRYPAPPLNGSAHTWHHSLDVLRRTINEGGGTP